MVVAKSFNELQNQIRTRYGELSNRLQQVAHYLLDNKNSIALETVAVIAKEADVPPSTLIRFANSFGFSGFNEMKQLFRSNLIEETSNYTDRARIARKMGEETPSERPHDILNEFSQANSQIIHKLASRIPAEDLQKAVDILASADTIYIVGLRRSFSIATYLTYALSHLNRRHILIDGMGGMFREQLSMIGKNDVVLSISFSPYAEETMMIHEIAANKNIRQIVITDSQISPLASLSDVCFVVKEAQVDAFRSQAATLCLVQSLVVSLVLNQDMLGN